VTQDTFMGKSIYHMPKRPTTPIGARIYPVKSSNDRLKLGQFQEIINLIKSTVSMPSDLYITCYEKLIHRYAEFVQLMPERIDYSSQSMLGNSLKRSYLITNHFQTLVKVSHGESFFQGERGARLLFAVFSSSLLFRVAKLIADKQIMLCDKDGKFIHNWAYFSGPLKQYGHYFKFRSTVVLSDAIISNMTIILAKQLMPSLGMAWLTEDREVLEAWFRALNIMDAFFGLHQMALDVEALMRESPLKTIHEEEYVTADSYLHGEAFWEWLVDHSNSIDRDLSLDKHGIGLVDGELLFDIDQMTKQYASEHKVNQSLVAQQFAKSGIAQMQGGDLAFRKVHGQTASSSAVSTTGLYAQQTQQVDKIDAKRFVGVDATIASAYFRGYNGLRNSESLSVDRLSQGIMQRLASVFLGNLSDGIDLINSGGGL